MTHTEANGFIVLLDRQNQPVTDRQPCRFAWHEGPGSFSCHMLSSHRITVPEEGASAIAVTDDQGQLIYAHRVVGGPLDPFAELIVEIDSGVV